MTSLKYAGLTILLLVGLAALSHAQGGGTYSITITAVQESAITAKFASLAAGRPNFVAPALSVYLQGAINAALDPLVREYNASQASQAATSLNTLDASSCTELNKLTTVKAQVEKLLGTAICK